MGQKASTHVNDSGATGSAQDGSPPVGPRGPTAQGKASGLKALFKGGSGGVRPAPHAGGPAEGRALQGEGGTSGALAWDPQVQVQAVGDDDGSTSKPKPYPNLKSAQPVKSALKKKGKELKVTLADVEAEEKAEQQRLDDQHRERIARKERLQSALTKASDPWGSFTSAAGAVNTSPSAAASGRPVSRTTTDSLHSPLAGRPVSRSGDSESDSPLRRPPSHSASPERTSGRLKALRVGATGTASTAVLPQAQSSPGPTSSSSPAHVAEGRGLAAVLPDLTDERASRGSRPSVSAPLRPQMAVEAREQERQQQQGEAEEQRASAPVAPARTRLAASLGQASSNPTLLFSPSPLSRHLAASGSPPTTAPLRLDRSSHNPGPPATHDSATAPFLSEKLSSLSARAVAGGSSPPVAAAAAAAAAAAGSGSSSVSAPLGARSKLSLMAQPRYPQALLSSSPGLETRGRQGGAVSSGPLSGGLLVGEALQGDGDWLEPEGRGRQVGGGAQQHSTREAEAMVMPGRIPSVSAALATAALAAVSSRGSTPGSEAAAAAKASGASPGRTGPSSVTVHAHSGQQVQHQALPGGQGKRADLQVQVADLSQAVTIPSARSAAAGDSPGYGRASLGASPAQSPHTGSPQYNPRFAHSPPARDAKGTAGGTPLMTTMSEGSSNKALRYADGPSPKGAPGGSDNGDTVQAAPVKKGRGCLKQEGRGFKVSLADVEAEERAAEKAEEDALEAAAEEKLRRRRALQRTVVKAPPSMVRRDTNTTSDPGTQPGATSSPSAPSPASPSGAASPSTSRLGRLHQEDSASGLEGDTALGGHGGRPGWAGSGKWASEGLGSGQGGRPVQLHGNNAPGSGPQPFLSSSTLPLHTKMGAGAGEAAGQMYSTGAMGAVAPYPAAHRVSVEVAGEAGQARLPRVPAPGPRRPAVITGLKPGQQLQQSHQAQQVQQALQQAPQHLGAAGVGQSDARLMRGSEGAGVGSVGKEQELGVWLPLQAGAGTGLSVWGGGQGSPGAMGRQGAPFGRGGYNGGAGIGGERQVDVWITPQGLTTQAPVVRGDQYQAVQMGGMGGGLYARGVGREVDVEVVMGPGQQQHYPQGSWR